MTETTHTVIGMSCDHCVRTVTIEIGRLPDVSGVDVDLATGQVRVTSEAPLDDDAVEAAVQEAGYEVAP